MTEQSRHVLSISDAAYLKGFVLDRVLKVSPATPNTITPSGGGTRWGDYDPTFANIEQDNWLDGIGHEFRDIRRSGLFDSRNAWTLTNNYLLPSMMWRWQTGSWLETYEYLSHGRNMDWQPAYGDSRYISSDFTIGGSGYDAGKVYIWVRRKGVPADATLAIYTDNGGNPNAAVASTSITIGVDDVPDYTSEWFGIDVSAASNLSASTKYHVVFDGGSGGVEASCWQVGMNENGSDSKKSTAASSWSAAGLSMYHRVIPTPVVRRWHHFRLEKADYWIDIRDDGGNSTLLINGDRGIATSATATTIVDSTKSWTADEWIGASVRIHKGTGKGQYRAITDNTTTGLTVATWDVTPNSTSQYVIYDCDQMNSVSTTGITTIKDVAVINNIVYFAQGSGDALVRARWNSGTPGYDWADDGSNKADVVFVDDDRVDGAQVWRGENDTIDISRSDKKNWGTNLTFRSAISVGGADHDIVDIVKFDKAIYIMKENHPYKVVNDKVEVFLKQLDFIPSQYQGVGAVAHDVFFYIPWGGWTLEEFFGSSLTDIGYKEFPSGRVGNYSFLVSHPAGLFCGIDAGDGTSSLMVRHKGRSSWHEIFRGYEAGARIRDGFWQDNPGSRPRSWFSINGELMSMKLPVRFNPVKDTTLEYHHETVVDFSIIDMNAASLFKYFQDFTLRGRNLTEEISVYLDYKLDADIEDSTKDWINVGQFTSVPRDVLSISRSELTKIQPRLRLNTNIRTTPPIVEAYNLEGFARTPLKFNYHITAKTSSNQIDEDGNPDHEPAELWKFLRDAATKAKILTLYSDWDFMDEIPVVVEPFTLLPNEPDMEGNWDGRFSFVVRDA